MSAGKRANRCGMGGTILRAIVLVLLVLLLVPAGTQRAHAAPADVTLCSANPSGIEGNGVSNDASISHDGRYVVFTSTSTNLLAAGPTLGQQIFRKDLKTGEVVMVSTNSAGIWADGECGDPSLSPEGRYVVFYSQATNLVTPATSGQQIFRKDLETGEVRLCSCAQTGEMGNAASYSPVVSIEGQIVAFTSTATNLVVGGTSGTQVFCKDFLNNRVVVCSRGEGLVGDGTSDFPCTNGVYVTFQSNSTNLVRGGTSGFQIFRKQVTGPGATVGNMELLSCTPSGVQGNSNSMYPAMNYDGRYVVFSSTATNLAPGGSSGLEVLRKDTDTGEVVLCSCDKSDNEGDNSSYKPVVSSDGRYVAFHSKSTNLVPGGSSGTQVFRKDLATKAVDLCSSDSSGTEGDGLSAYPAITSNGKYVAFESLSSNLVTPGTTSYEIFRKELTVPTTFYFAEGYSGEGFQEYLCLGNPESTPLVVTVTYLFEDDPPVEKTYNIGPDSRFTANVNAEVGPIGGVAIKCEAETKFIAERPMYFGFGGTWKGGHDSVGSTATSYEWYFAEGYTGAGFSEWISVLNPGNLDLKLDLYFQTQEEGEKIVNSYPAPARSRRSYNVNDLLGGGSYQTSLKVICSGEMVVERSMYFDYQGTGGWGWSGGHCCIGATCLENSFYFAEGTTRSGFEEWLTLQNPWDTAIDVNAVYQLGDGPPVVKDYALPPARRSTIYVPAEVGAEKDVSVLLTSDSLFLAERPMYFDYQGMGAWGWTGGHCVIGSACTGTEWYFAEGYTGQYFEEWLSIQNPGDSAAVITVTYYPEGGSGPIVREHVVQPFSRYTIPVNVDAGPDLSLSAKISSTRPVIVERPMYFNYNGVWPGGHDVVGYIP